MSAQESYFSLLIAIIAAIIAAFSAHFLVIDRDRRKRKKEGEEQCKFLRRVVNLIQNEINGYLGILSTLQKDSDPSPINSAHPDLLQIDIEKLNSK